MAIHNLQPENVKATVNIKLKIEGENDKHEEEQEKPVSKSGQDQPDKKA